METDRKELEKRRDDFDAETRALKSLMLKMGLSLEDAQKERNRLFKLRHFTREK